VAEDVLVAAAGVTLRKNAVDMTSEEWGWIIGVSLTGVWLCLRAALRHMVAQGNGSIVVVSSLAALRGVGSPAYSASKGGVVALACQVEVEYAGAGIRVNVVCPGPVRTPMLERSALVRRPDDLEAGLAELQSFIPLGTVGEPVDVAEAIVYLAGDRSSFVSGAVLPVGGGVAAA